MASVTKENLGNLHDKLVVKVSKEDYLPSFEKSVKGYSKKANVPGFRKGMVPAGMIKKMYGPSLFYEEVVKTVEKQLQDYMMAEKPEIFAQPLPMENDLSGMNMNQPEDYEFSFEMGLKPEIDLTALYNSTPTLYKVDVTPELVEEELQNLLSKNANKTDADSIESADNELQVSVIESDENGIVAEGAVSQAMILSLKDFSEDVQQQLMGKKESDSATLKVDDSFSAEGKSQILEGIGFAEDADLTNKYVTITINKIVKNEARELNAEFFKLIFPTKELTTEEDFRAALKEEMQKQWDAATKNQLHDQLYHIALETPIELPEAFLKRWLEIGQEKPKSKEQVEEEFPKFVDQLKWTLISDSIIKENNLEVTPEELRDSMKQEVMRYFGQIDLGTENTEWIDSYLDRMMADEKQVENTYRRSITEKLFQWMETNVTPEEKQVSDKEFTKLVENHHHH